MVEVGSYIDDITRFDLKDNTFRAVFWIWFRWKDGKLNPLETFEVVRGDIVSRDSVFQTVLSNGTQYAVARVIADIHGKFDLERFPLDNHSFVIKIEDGEHEKHQLQYVPDLANSAFNPELSVVGWLTRSGSYSTGTSVYKSNYGDPTIPTGSVSEYSYYRITIDVVRDGYWFLIKLMFPTYCAVFISLLAFFISPTNIEPRFGLGVGAVFAAIANSYVTTQSLPDSQVITLADALSNVAALYIFVGLVASTASLYLFNNGYFDRSKLFDRASVGILSLSYLAANIMLIVFW